MRAVAFIAIDAAATATECSESADTVIYGLPGGVRFAEKPSASLKLPQPQVGSP